MDEKYRRDFGNFKMGYRKTSPCKGCTDRTVKPNCHSTCERFLADSKECQRIATNRYEEKKVTNGYYAVRKYGIKQPER